MPFVDAVPFSAWICTPLPKDDAHDQEPKPSRPELAGQSGNSPPGVMREELGQVGKRYTHWQADAAPNSQSPKAFPPQVLVQRKLSKPNEKSIPSSSLLPSNSTPNLQQSSPEGDYVVTFNHSTDETWSPHAHSNIAGGLPVTAKERICSSLPSSPQQLRKDNFGCEAPESPRVRKLKACLSDSASIVSLPESSSSGSQDGYIFVERQLSEAPPAYDALGDLPPPYEPFSRQLGPVQNGLGSSDVPGILLEDAPPLPEKVPLSASAVSDAGEFLDGNLSDQDASPAQLADMSILVAVSETVNVRFDHFQLIFLLRMQEMLVKMQEDLETENAGFENAALEPSAEGKSIPAVTCSIVTQGVELNVILPPKPEAETRSASQNTNATGSYLEADLLSDGGSESPLPNCTARHSRERGSVGSKDELVISGSNSNSKAQSTSSAESLLNLRPESAQSVGGISGRTSTASIPDADAWSVTGSAGRRGSDSSASSNLDSGVSLKDSENKPSGRSSKEMKKISIFAVEGSCVHLGIQLQGDDTVVKVEGQELKINEQGTLEMEKYLNQKSFRTSRAKAPLPVTPGPDPMVRVRAEFGPGAKRNEPSAGERGFAHVKLTGLAASLLLSSMEGLSECFEDELVLPPVPFLVELANSRVSLNNDLPPRLLSAPPPIPINVAIESISIRRNQDGLLNIKAIDLCSDLADINEPPTMTVTGQDSVSPSELSLSDSVSSRIERLENEKQTLQAQLSVSRTALRSVHEERQALLHTIARLQQELSISNREQERMREKLVSQRRGSAAKWYH